MASTDYPQGMKKPTLLALALAVTSTASCSTSTSAITDAANTSAASAETATAAAAAEAAAEAEAEAAKVAEEAKAKAAAAQLEVDRAALKVSHEAAKARFVPAMNKKVKALATKSYPNGKAALEAALKSPHRLPGNAARDGDRHPLKTMEFFGLKPDMTVLEYGPGGGWWTEILAPALHKKGKLIVTNGDDKGPPELRSTYYAERVSLLLQESEDLYGKVEVQVVDGKKPALTLDKNVDMVFVARGLHGMINNGTLEAWLGQFHKALKDKGVLAIEQHRAKEGADAKESSKQGYVPEAYVIAAAEAAGFKLEAKSEVNANPKDTKDYPEGVWALPPSLRRGETDKEAMTAIGESDRMTLKFVKVAKAPEAPVKP